ncbi:porin family protein [Pontibacter oryzae]|uniref:PorT family protein n=1 Tax=Pontibacter oryzae TaxID=2304593 RepID=A0A399SFB7_9BACT|nr:porin family protein [Pontibacter oryzae]RIJ41509.1 PorT family protein [Pontibacter oryzae]
MKTTLLAAFCLFSLSAAAQSGFKNGYYTSTAGDTVQTQIQDEDWIKNPDKISITQQGNTLSLSQSQMSGFGITQGDVYRKFAVNIDTSPVSLNTMELNQPAVIVRDTVMLRLLVSGTANLYELRDKEGKLHYYIQKGEEEPAELMFRKIKTEVNGKKVIATLEPYKGLLQVYLSDCGITERMINGTSFKAESFASVINAYNTCKEPAKQEYMAKEEKVRWYFGATAGYGLASYTIYNKGMYDELAGSEFSSLNPNAAVLVNMVLPRGHGRWGISSELGYKRYKMSGSYAEFKSSSSSSEYQTEFNLQYAAFNTQVVYTFKGNSWLRPFVSAGLALNMLVADNSLQTSTRRQYGVERSYENPPLAEMRKLEQSLLLGGGVNYSKLILSARYERGNGFSPYNGLKVVKTATTMQLAYLFN